MMDEKAFDFFSALAKDFSFHNVEELSYQLDMSERSLREVVRIYKDDFEEKSGARLLFKTNFGYRIDVLDITKFQCYLENTKKGIRENQVENPNTSKDRTDYILRKLLLSKTPIKTEDMCEELNVSKSTLAIDLKNVREELDKYSLKLEVKGKQGLYISGDLKDLRMCVSDSFFYHSDALDINIPLFENCTNIQGKEWIKSQVLDEIQKKKYHMSDIGVENLSVHLFITLLMNQLYGEDTKANIRVENYPTEKEIAENIIERIHHKTGIKLSDNDIGYIIVHMIGNKVFTEKDANILSYDTLNTVRKILTEIQNIYAVNLFNDIDLFTMLCVHIEPMIQRLNNHVRMHNPLVQQVYEENPLGYDMAVLASEIIAKKYNVVVDQNEIGYLALHFQLALERKNDLKSFRVLTVCASGVGTSRILKYKLERQFGDKMQVIDSCSLVELSAMDLSKYDLIISTIPLQEVSKPVIVVNCLLSDVDYNTIDSFLNKDSQLLDEVLKAFDEELFIDHLDVKDAKDAIYELCIELGKKTKLPVNFEKKVIDREQIASTYTGHGVAVPHPSSILLDENKVVIAHVDKPVMWFNHKEVQWIILLGMKKGDDQISESIVRILYDILSDASAMVKLKRNFTYQMWIDTIISHFEPKQQESIFK